jgi:hypothetical protein
MVGYFWKGLWNTDVSHYYLLTLPATIPAIWIGRLLNERLPLENFRKFVFGGLILIGLVLVLQAVWF